MNYEVSVKKGETKTVGLRELSDNEYEVTLDGATVGDVLLCHATLPTKNGPSRSRWSDVCFVLRIRWTITESGCSSGPSRPTTKSQRGARFMALIASRRVRT